MNHSLFSIFYDNSTNNYKLSHKNFNYPIHNNKYKNYKITVVGNPIIYEKINTEKSIEILKIFIDSNFNNKNILNTLNGEFIFIINNTSDDQIIVVNDRFASIPLYYTEIKNKLFLSNNFINILKEIKSNDKIKIDRLSLFEFLYFKRLHGENTYEENTLFLKAGSILKVNNSINIERYNKIHLTENKNNIIDNSFELSDLLNNAIKRKINSDYSNYGLFLSGGMDTRYISAHLNQIDNNKKILYYTLGWDTNGEYEITKKVCEIIKSKNIFMQIDENYYDNFNIEKLYMSNGMYNMFQNIFLNLKQHMSPKTNVLFHGHGLDYMFQGMYIPSKNFKILSRPTFFKKIINIDYKDISKKYLDNISYKVKNKFLKILIKQNYYNEFEKNIETRISTIVKQSREFTNNPYKSWEYIMNHNQSRHYSYTDVIGIGSNLEQRKITNDNDLYNFYMSLPIEQRLHGKIIKKSLLNINKNLGNLISANTRMKITSSPIELTLQSYSNKILYILSRDKNYIFPQGKRRTWPNEHEILKNSFYFRKKIQNLHKSDYLNEYLNFINFDKLKIILNDFLYTDNHNEFAQYIFLLMTLEELFREI